MNSEEIRRILGYDDQKNGGATGETVRKTRKRLCSGEIRAMLHPEDEPSGGISETWKQL